MALNWHVSNPNMVGGGIVRRPFTSGALAFKAGQQLARDQILAIPVANRNALIGSGMIEVFPVAANAERYLVPAAKGLFHVVEGRRVTAEPLSKDEAEALIAETKAKPRAA